MDFFRLLVSLGRFWNTFWFGRREPLDIPKSTWNYRFRGILGESLWFIGHFKWHNRTSDTLPKTVPKPRRSANYLSKPQAMRFIKIGFAVVPNGAQCPTPDKRHDRQTNRQKYSHAFVWSSKGFSGRVRLFDKIWGYFPAQGPPMEWPRGRKHR